MRRRRTNSHTSHDRWLISYADFITLLFGLFVVLFAFAKADQKKQVQVTESIDSAFRSLGIFSSSTRHPSAHPESSAVTDKPVIPMNIVMGEDVLSPAQVKDDLERIRRELAQSLSNQVANHTVSIRMGHDGLIISLREAGFFASGAAIPRPETLATLRRIAESLARSPYDLRVEGHTDNVPIHNQAFDSNWELSSARATGIARMMLQIKAVPPERLSAAGYAEFHPVASNDTVDGRAENRRVDLVVQPRTKTNLALGNSFYPSGAWRKITDGDDPNKR
jgi:chemotaxis protein MotB